MKHCLKYSLVVLIALFFGGCNLSRFPIDDPAHTKIDTRLLGQWKTDGVKGKGKGDRYTLARQDSTHYRLTVKEHGKSEPKDYIAFLSEVRDGRFLNVHYKEDSTDGYLFIRILDISPDNSRMTVANVSDSTMGVFVSAAQARERVYNNLNNEDFYSDTVTLKRTK